MHEEPLSRLRVAIVAPPWYAVPPSGYGGIEIVVYLLAEQLAELGHDVTVFGRQGGRGNFEHIALAPESWTPDLGARDHPAREASYLRSVYRVIRNRPFDVVHENTGYAGMLLASMLHLQSAAVATLHGDLTEADARFLGSIERDVELVAISHAQEGMVAGVRWAGVVHNAVDTAHLEYRETADDYLLELARICPEKGQDVAIEVARESGRRLVLAGKVGEGSEDFFRQRIKPHLGDQVEWIENVEGRAKADLLAGAAAMLFPIQWEEPFGLAMVEAMASGTPVVATPRGAAVEIVEDGVTGFMAEDEQHLVAAVERLGEIDREACCRRARERFSSRRMADEYIEVYQAAITRKRDRV